MDTLPFEPRTLPQLHDNHLEVFPTKYCAPEKEEVEEEEDEKLYDESDNENEEDGDFVVFVGGAL